MSAYRVTAIGYDVQGLGNTPVSSLAEIQTAIQESFSGTLTVNVSLVDANGHPWSTSFAAVQDGDIRLSTLTTPSDSYVLTEDAVGLMMTLATR